MLHTHTTQPIKEIEEFKTLKEREAYWAGYHKGVEEFYKEMSERMRKLRKVNK